METQQADISALTEQWRTYVEKKNVDTSSIVSTMQSTDEVEIVHQVETEFRKDTDLKIGTSFYSAVETQEAPVSHSQGNMTDSHSSTSFLSLEQSIKTSDERIAGFKPETLKKVDRYGFEISSTFGNQDIVNTFSSSLSGHRHSTLKNNESFQQKKLRLLQENSTIENWLKIIPKLEMKLLKKNKFIKKQIRKGVPDSLRGKIWPILILNEEELKKRTTKSYKRSQPQARAERDPEYSIILSRLDSFIQKHFPTSTDEENPPSEIYSKNELDTEVLSIINSINCIKRDLNRTFPSHELFSKSYEEGGFGQNALLNILSCFALIDPKVGYCQGMGFVVGLFLNYLPEDKVFKIVKRLFTEPPYNMKTLYQDEMPGVQSLLFQLEHLIPKYCKNLDTAMKEHGVIVNMFATHWFVTIYSYNYPWEFVLRVWDLFLFMGWKIVMQVAIALLQIVDKKVVIMRKTGILEFENILNEVKLLPQYINVDALIKQASGIKLKRKQLEKLEMEFRAKLEINASS
eukprot:snap_masked-scaffold_7-processed-gene-2.38-mRNA-1 protein AED:0.32 eAED:0.33 QI:0/-1/0/1/-1/1/1/0/515